MTWLKVAMLGRLLITYGAGSKGGLGGGGVPPSYFWQSNDFLRPEASFFYDLVSKTVVLCPPEKKE